MSTFFAAFGDGRVKCHLHVRSDSAPRREAVSLNAERQLGAFAPGLGEKYAQDSKVWAGDAFPSGLRMEGMQQLHFNINL
ncbi:hypothetical protein C6558_31975 [Ensifer sp. NM-2]|nr:hypothetical protein C6558_31975 [Ensifer sp. NM-2]